jgi:PBSX family phage terminase large subunit
MMFRFAPLPSQKWMIEAHEGFTEGHDVAYLQGGLGSGKTLPGAFCCVMMSYMLSARVKNCVGLVCAPTNTILDRATIPTYIELLEQIGLEEGKHYRFNRSKKIMTFTCWSNAQLIFASLDNPMAVRSINAAFAHIDEASVLKSQQAFIEVVGRVRQVGVKLYRIFVTSNPEISRGWMSELFPKAGEARIDEMTVTDSQGNDRTGRVVYRKRIAATIDNPYLEPSFIANLKASMDDDSYRIFVLGEDGELRTGLVASTWSDNNISKDVEYDPKLDLLVSCDFNVDPMCWVIGQRQRNGEFWILDELALENTTTYMASEELARRWQHHKGRVILHGDPNGNARNTSAMNTRAVDYTIMQNVLSSYGYSHVELNVARAAPLRDERVHSFNAACCNMQGVRRVFVHPKCSKIIYNMENLRYKEGTGMFQDGDKTNKKEKFLGHMYDALTYMIDKYMPVRRTHDYRRTGRNVYIPFTA